MCFNSNLPLPLRAELMSFSPLAADISELAKQDLGFLKEGRTARLHPELAKTLCSM